MAAPNVIAFEIADNGANLSLTDLQMLNRTCKEKVGSYDQINFKLDKCKITKGHPVLISFQAGDGVSFKDMKWAAIKPHTTEKTWTPDNPDGALLLSNSKLILFRFKNKDSYYFDITAIVGGSEKNLDPKIINGDPALVNVIDDILIAIAVGVAALAAWTVAKIRRRQSDARDSTE